MIPGALRSPDTNTHTLKNITPLPKPLAALAHFRRKKKESRDLERGRRLMRDLRPCSWRGAPGAAGKLVTAICAH